MTTQNDSGVHDVPTTVDDVDRDMELFNLSVLSDNDLLPDELPHQVSVSASCYIAGSHAVGTLLMTTS